MITLITETASEANDREFMLKLYCDYNRLMYFIANKCLSDHFACEEVVQDTVLKLILKIPLLRRLDENALAAYVSAAVRNTAYSLLRKQSKEQKIFLPWNGEMEHILVQDVSPEENLILMEQKHAFIKIWQEIEQEDRFLLEGRYILRYTDRELAEEIGCQPNSVRMKLTRARRKVLKQMKIQSKGGDDSK